MTRAAIAKLLPASVLVAALFAAPPAYAHDCHETSDIVSERRCSRYGQQWSKERSFPIVIGIGLVSGHTEPLNRSFRGSFGKENPIKFTLPGTALGLRAVDDVGMDFRMHIFASPHLYFGADWALALASVRTNLQQQPGFELEGRGGVNFLRMHAGAVAGGRIPLGIVSLRIEAVLGFRMASVMARYRQPGSEWIDGSFTNLGALVEPRVAVDIWTTPWSTVTGWAGRNLIEPTDHSIGISFALHGRPFDGRFGL